MERQLEEVLVKRCRNGETEAFGPLVQIYRRRLYSYLLRMCNDKDLADDLFQEVLIKVWKGIKVYNEENKFSSWLFTIAHNVLLDNYRKNKKEKYFVEYEKAEPLESPDNVHEIIENKESANCILKEVAKIPASQREVFLLRENLGLTFKEIAELRKEPINTVLSHMHYAVKKIKKALEEKNAI